VQLHFLRTAAGAEIDLVLEFASERWAIEIKHSSAPVPSRGFFEGSRDIEATRRVLPYPGSDAWRLRNDVEVLPIPQLMRELLHRHGCRSVGSDGMPVRTSLR